MITIIRKKIISNNEYENVIYIWRQLDPSKRFNEFSYEDIDNFKDVNEGYCNKNEILLINGDFYIYSGEKKYYSTENKKAIMQFKNKAKIIKEIEADVEVKK